MNAISSSQSTRWLLVCFCALILAPVFAGSIFAAAPSENFAVSSPILQANIVFDWASDRTRMIQFSLVIVTIGVAIMWWYR